jgi:uncharacterized RmlC-like cupin family protein
MQELSMSQAEVDAALQQLFAATDDLLTADETAAQPFRSALPRPAFQHQAAEGEGDLPICRYWPGCLEQDDTSHPAVARAAAALRRLTPVLRWRQNPNYRQAPPSRDFLANYGYAELCGSYGLIAAEMRLGVLVLGPETCYPAHRHPAEEIYLPLGPGAWQRGEAEVSADRWIDRPAGSFIHHPPFVPHATRGLSQAIAALYLWRGDLATEAKLDAGQATA